MYAMYLADLPLFSHQALFPPICIGHGNVAILSEDFVARIDGNWDTWSLKSPCPYEDKLVAYWNDLIKVVDCARANGICVPKVIGIYRIITRKEK